MDSRIARAYAWTANISYATCVAIIATVYALFLIINFDLPGPQMDFVNHVAFAPGILDAKAAALPHYRLPDNIFGMYRYPIVGGSTYNTTIMPYLGLPFFLVFGFTLGGLKAFYGILALLAILVVHHLVRGIAGALPGLLVGIYLCTEPLLVFAIRAPGVYFFLTFLLSGLALIILMRAARSKSKSLWLPFLAGLTLGLAGISYFVGAYFVVPFGLYGLFIWRNSRKQILVFLVAGFVGVAPWLFSMLSIYVTSPNLLAGMGMPAWAERKIDTLSLENIQRVFSIVYNAFIDFSYPRYVAGWFEPVGRVPRAVLVCVMFFAGLLPLLLSTELKRKVPEVRHVLIVLVLSLCLYVIGAFLLKATTAHHLIPLLFLLAVLYSGYFLVNARFSRVFSVLMAGVIVINVVCVFRAHKALDKTGGFGVFNEAYGMPAELMRTAFSEYHPVFVGWGFHLPFLFLTRGEIPYSFVGAGAGNIDKLMAKHYRLVVFVNENERAQLDFSSFRIRDILNFHQRDGVPLYNAYLLEAKL